MKNNAIIIVLLLFLAVTSFFWFQSLKTQKMPAKTTIAASEVSGRKAEEFIRRVEMVTMRHEEPLPHLYGRDPFYKEKPALDLSKTFTLSSVSYSASNALAVVNGKILAEGDTLYEPNSGLTIVVKSIEVDGVKVINDDKEYILEKAH